MDVNATLDRIREIIAHLDHCLEGAMCTVPMTDELISLVSGLDEWLSKGGFLPNAWQQGR